MRSKVDVGEAREIDDVLAGVGLPTANRENLRVRRYGDPGESYECIDIEPRCREKHEVEQAVSQSLAHSSRVRLDGDRGHERNWMQEKRDAAEIGEFRRRMQDKFAVRARERSDQPQSAAGGHQNPECICPAVRSVGIGKQARIGPERQQAHKDVAEGRSSCAVREQERHSDKPAADYEPGGE